MAGWTLRGLALMLACAAGVPQFRSAVDSVAVYATVSDSSGRLVPDLTREDFQILDNDQLYGPSPIWDSTYRAIESFPESGSRRAIILVTDGRATGNTHSIEDVARAAILRRVSINIVGQDLEYRFNQSPTTAVAVRPGNALQWLADVTGGRFISATALLMRPAQPLTAILTGLRHTYTLTFEAPEVAGKPHELEVRVLRPNLKVRAQHFYGGPG